MVTIRGILVLLLSGCCAAAQGQRGENIAPLDAVTRVETVVRPLPGEDIAADCRYNLTLPEPKAKVRGVWVIFDRGRDVHDLAADPKVMEFARRSHLAILLHGHCPGKLESDHGDMNMEPLRGLGPALFRALDQLAVASSHPELARARLILLGFSGAGVLSARLVAEYPQRVIAAVLAAPGHYPPFGIDTVHLSEQAQAVPQMVIAGGADEVSGTQRPYGYFETYRRLGAPMTFVLQNRSPHCCTANPRDLILDWLDYVLRVRTSPAGRDGPLHLVNQRAGWLGSIQLEPAATTDSFGFRTYNVERAAITLAERSKRKNGDAASWLPTKAIAEEWLAFIEQPSHPVLPLR